MGAKLSDTQSHVCVSKEGRENQNAWCNAKISKVSRLLEVHEAGLKRVAGKRHDWRADFQVLQESTLVVLEY